MKTSLDHLPESKRNELEIITRTIREEIEVEMIILFGSYARGNWVEEMEPDGVHYQFQSGFNIPAFFASSTTKSCNSQNLWRKTYLLA